MSRQLICGLLAHVDAGKTTLSEDMLFLSGALRKAGRVDNGDTFLDTDALEKERGITIFSKMARLSWKDTQITLMDTPGHVDFSGEMERVLDVLDCAVLLISAADGVQSHTVTEWKLLERYGVPVILFVNKMDREDADRQSLLAELQSRLSEAVTDISSPDADEYIALCDEEAWKAYEKDGAVSEKLRCEMTGKRKLFPCFFGSALKMTGIEELLNGICSLIPAKQYPREFGAKVFKIGRDKQDARLTFMKITGGFLRSRDVLSLNDDGKVWDEKADRILLYSGDKYTQADEVTAGCVCAVTGLEHTRAGQGIGTEKDSPRSQLEGVFTYHVNRMGQDAAAVLSAMRRLEEEDPLLRVQWNGQTREIRARVMGEVQLEVLQRKLKDRFGLNITFDEGSVLYKETITDTVEGVGHYEPLRHYAEVHLLLEPGEKGSGLVFDTKCSLDELDRNWQRLILTHLYEKQHVGVLTGAPVTDMKITLIAGRDHLKHTEGGDFRQATYRAVRNGLMRARSVLLEPWYEFELTLPPAQLGRAMTDLERMGGRFSSPEDTRDGMMKISGFVPVVKARGYGREVTSYTGGRGHLELRNGGYEPCADSEAVIRASGYNPLADLENSPDSVFCSHGAGFNVPWNKVREYMHIQTGAENTRGGGNLNDSAPAGKSKKPSAPKSAAEEDRELMAIFERTYGAVRPRSFDPQPRTAPVLEQREVSIPETEFLLVDGYNVIFAWDDLKALSRQSLESARHVLAEILCNFQGVRKARVILVFDAYKVKHNPGYSEQYKNITIVYTGEAETADNYIEKTTYKLKGPYRARVVTSDGLEQIITMGHGSLRTSAREFRQEVEQVNIEIARFIEENNRHPVGNTVADAAIRALDRAKKQTDRNPGTGSGNRN
ncbi:MAG: translation elongation factor G [Clostridiales bacterium]|nr:translation elongation factor G [Clostridiales bacterium]